MAQASSVQREPSMEEILASIRRIIEDNESGRKDMSISGDLAEDSDNGDAEVESFRDGPNSVSAPATAAEEREAEDDSFADLRDPLRNEAAQPQIGSTMIPVANDGMKERPVFRIADAEPASPEDDDGEAGQEPQLSVSPAVTPEPVDTGREAILSEAPGRKVAAAFSELNEVLWESRRKSLDQMAEEMLRPMLQEWLDNNLPQMVERLVREEIERIARGA